MLSREELETFRTNHIKARDQLIARVNVCQGAIDSATALLKLWDDNENKQDETEKKEPGDGSSEG